MAAMGYVERHGDKLTTFEHWKAEPISAGAKIPQ
jgi:hypothetical protein